MDSNTQYVCTLTDSEELAQAAKELREYQERREEQGEFLKRQLKALQDEHKLRWRNVWNAGKAAGKIPQAYSYDDYHMQLAGPGHTQLFIMPSKDAENGIGGLLKTLFDR